MKKIRFAFFAVLSVLVFSCQQEIDPSIISVNNGNTGGNGGNSSDSYQPLTAGTWWKYKDSTSGTVTTSTVTNLTQTVNSILYSKVKNSSSSQDDTSFLASPRPKYYMRAAGQSPNSGAPFDLTFELLNDTASVGYNWSYVAGQGNGFTANVKTTIVEKNISVTIGSNTFNNVIHTKLDLAYDIFGTSTDIGSYDIYMAKGVGIVRLRFALPGFTSSCSDLVDYHVQ